MLYTITWHMLYNITWHMLCNILWHMLYNITWLFMLYNITWHIMLYNITFSVLFFSALFYSITWRMLYNITYFLLNLTIIPRVRVGYEMIDSQRGAYRRVGFNHLISNKREWNNCFIKKRPQTLVESLRLNFVRTNQKRQGTSAIHMSRLS